MPQNVKLMNFIPLEKIKKQSKCFFHSVLSEDLNNFNYEYDRLTRILIIYNFEQYVYCFIIWNQNKLILWIILLVRYVFALLI